MARLINRLREAITYYQVGEYEIIASTIVDMGEEVSQQQAIYDQITDLTVRIPRFASPCCTDDRSFYQVVFLCALETP